MLPRRIFATVFSGIFLLSGCGGMAPMAAKDAAMESAAYGGAEEAPGAPAMDTGITSGFRGSYDVDGRIASMQATPTATATSATSSSPPTTGEAVQQRGPMLIYTATMNMAVFQVVEAAKQVETMALESGGFLARRDDHSLVIRIPAAKFQDILLKIEKLGDVLHRNVVAEDVTEQYMDAEVRLKNARAVRDRLQQLLEKANKVEDSLAIEKELTRIGNEIETLEGKLKYLRDRAAYSTITVNFQPKRTDTVKPTVRLPVDWLNQLGLGRLLDL